MVRLLAWLLGAIGLARLAKALRNRDSGARRPAVPEPADPRADELRRRLEEAKPLASEPHDEGETTIDAAPDPAPARTRADVHAQARAAIAEMQDSGPAEGGDADGEAARDA